MLELALRVLSGTLSLANTTGLTFTRGDGHDDAEIRCVGSSAAVNAALDPIRYTPFPDYNSVSQGGWIFGRVDIWEGGFAAQPPTATLSLTTTTTTTTTATTATLNPAPPC